MQKIYLFRVMAIAMIFLFSKILVVGQTNPTTATMPVSFTSQSGSTLPTFMAIHRFGTTAATIPTSRITTDGNADLPNTATNNSGGWIAETNDGVSILASGSNAAGAILFEFSTTGKENIQVSAVRWTKLDQLSRTMSIALQYRVGDTGTWIDIDSPSSSVYSTGTAGRTNGSLDTQTLPSLANNNSIVQVRWIYWESATGAGGSRDRLGLDEVSITGSDIVSGSTLISINEVSILEGNSGTTNVTFNVSLSAPAPIDGVTFDIATAEISPIASATAGSDYVAKSLSGQTIAAGTQGPYTFTVEVNGDATTELNETFNVNITNIVGANAGDVQGLGTITNDDVSITNIHDIQGSGTSSSLAGASITTTGIVTAVRSSGFYIQNPIALYDADQNTSEGVLVFTQTAPPAAAQVGNMVQVNGTVVEFTPTQDPTSPTLTEITMPTVVQLSSGNPLPAAIPLTSTFPDPAGMHDQLERVEGMLVMASSLEVVAPTSSNVSEANATATSNGVIYGVIPGIARPFREPGIPSPDLPPAGSIPPIPRFDGNPELIRVNTLSITGSTAVDVSVGATLTNVVGPLDYAFRSYTILTNTAPTAAGGLMAAIPVMDKGANQFTVASYNMERFFDTTDEPGTGDVVLTNTAFANRLNKASLSIRNILKTPDIVAVIEMENLSALQSIATKVNADAVSNGNTDPQYQAYLIEGNDVGGIDVGFLIKNTVTINSVTQLFKTSTFIDPTDMSVDILNDRPPLQLKATINHSSGKTFPITILVNHLRSLNGVSAADNGGIRIREKRKKQAEELANYVQSLQMANAAERIVLVGDFNAFEFNDGLVDIINTIKGTPTPDNETAVAGDGADLVTPNLFIPTLPAGSYSYSFVGNAQFLDHAIMTQNLANFISKTEYVKLNADFAGIIRSDANRPERLSDHDPLLTTFNFCPTPLSILATSINLSSTNICAAQEITLTATCPSGYTANWYKSLENSVELLTSGSPAVISSTSTSTIKVTCKDVLCESDFSDAGTVTVTSNTDNITTISSCNTYTWANNNQTYTMSGTYTGTTTNCVTEKLILTINTKAPAVITNETICVGGTYTWSVNEQTYNTATSVTVTGVDCAADQILNLIIDNSSCSDAICTTLPSNYANSEFMACTPSGSLIGVADLMNNALGEIPKTFGLTANNRTFTLDPTDISEGNMYTMMAGISNASSKFGLGGATYSTSSTWPRVPLNTGGQLANALFRNAITLFFNLQNSANLGAVPMANIHYTQPLTACGALNGTGVITSYQMPTVVISYLNNVANGYPATVEGLYQLANDALGGKTGVPNLSTIASAMDKINKAFNGCRLISTPESTPSVFGTGLRVTENSNLYGKGGVYITLIEGDAFTGNILGVAEIGSNGISGFDPILNNNYKLILGTDPEGSRTPKAPSGYKIVGEKVTYFNEDQSFAGPSNNGNADGEIVIGLANINAAKVATGNKIEVEFLLEQSAPLPVILLSFTGKKQNNSNLLEWKTANEKAFDGFEIQKSENGKTFEKIGFVKGGSKENYQFSDNNLIASNNFYRLKMIDLDGKFDFSKIIAIQTNTESTLVGKVYPNPTIDKTAFVEITTEKAGKWKLSTFNAMGTIQTTTEIQLSKGANKISVELDNLMQGIYFLNFENSKGEKFVRKLIKD